MAIYEEQPTNPLPRNELERLLNEANAFIGTLQSAGRTHPSRELSLAITNAQQAESWLLRLRPIH